MEVAGTTSGAQAGSQMAQIAAGTQASDSGSGWDAAGAPQTPPAAAQASGVPSDTQTPAPTPPAAPGAPGTPPASMQPQKPELPAPVQPVVVTSQKKGGILGVVDSITDALTGKTKPELGTDAQGNQYIKQQTLSRGEQWVRIGAGLLGGAAKGWAAGKGRNPGAAAAAGFAEGQQQRQMQAQQTPELQKQMLANANYQKLRMDAAEQSWHLTAMQHEATQHDIQFAQGQEDRLMKVDGATLLGTAENPNDIDKILKVDPKVMKAMVQNHQIEILPHYNPDGTAGGIRVFKMPDGYRNTIEPAGSVFHTFDSITGQYVEHHTSEPITAGELDDYETAAGNTAQKFKLDQAKLAQTQAQTAEAKANAGKAPSEIAKNKAGATESYAAANKDNAEAAKDRSLTEQAADPTLVTSIGTGKIAPERMAYLLARNPQLLEAVTKQFPDFDSSKAESYPGVYKEFTSTKTNTAGGALNAGATAMEHLLELRNLNTVKSHIPGTADYNAYHNKLDTLAPELAKFYGDTTIPAIDALKKTLGATLPGNRDAAITTQAQSMGRKFDNYEQSWRNAAPSAAYEAPMPNVSDEAKEARAALDPQYRQRQVQATSPAPAAHAAATPPPAPPAAPAGMSNIWAPGSPTWKQVPANQVPKNIPGLVVR